MHQPPSLGGPSCDFCRNPPGYERSVWGLLSHSGQLLAKVMDQNNDGVQHFLYEPGDPLRGLHVEEKLTTV